MVCICLKTIADCIPVLLITIVWMGLRPPFSILFCVNRYGASVIRWFKFQAYLENAFDCVLPRNGVVNILWSWAGFEKQPGMFSRQFSGLFRRSHFATLRRVVSSDFVFLLRSSWFRWVLTTNTTQSNRVPFKQWICTTLPPLIITTYFSSKHITTGIEDRWPPYSCREFYSAP